MDGFITRPNHVCDVNLLEAAAGTDFFHAITASIFVIFLGCATVLLFLNIVIFQSLSLVPA